MYAKYLKDKRISIPTIAYSKSYVQKIKAVCSHKIPF